MLRFRAYSSNRRNRWSSRRFGQACPMSFKHCRNSFGNQERSLTMVSKSLSMSFGNLMTGARAPLRASIRANASRTSTAICSCVPPDSTANCSRVPVRSKAARSTSSASNRNSASGQASGHQRRGNRLEHDCSVPSFWLPLPCWAAFATNKESDRANVDFLALCRSY